MRKMSDPRAIAFLFTILTASTGQVQAHPAHSLILGLSFGGYFPVPAYGIAGFYYPGRVQAGAYVPGPGRPYYAFVDTDIHPEKAHVYLGGRLIGVADDFDGYPGYLVLKPGSHTLSFVLDGYRPLSFELKLRPGELIDLDRKLPRSAHGAQGLGESPETSPEMGAEKVDSNRTRSTARVPAGDYGALRLTISPPGARVILDGSFFGTGLEISRLHGGIALSPGVHRIRVSLEGYRSETVEAPIVGSEESRLSIHLQER